MVEEGKEAFFIPKMKKTLYELGLRNGASNLLNKIGIKDKLPIEPDFNDSLLKKLENLTAEQSKNFPNETGISVEEAKQLIKSFKSKSVTEAVAEEIKKMTFSKKNKFKFLR